MVDMAEERFEQAMEDIDRSLSDTLEIAAEFSKEMSKLQSPVQETSRSLSTLERGVSRGMRRAIDGVVFDGANLSEALRSLGTSMLNSGYRAAINPVADHLGGVLAGGLNSLLQGMTPFARGGEVSQATGFAMSGGGLGVMGEAGPEAILPLARGMDGRPGVQAGAVARPVQITMNITTPDVAGFAKSQSQIAAQMSRAMSRASRNR